MNEYFVDLHIHTALSPCADNDMTPNNIVNMSLLKGLNFIAITDHNCAKNVEVVLQCAKGKDIIVVPGMEVETSEEIHLLCLFKEIEDIADFQKEIHSCLPLYKNKEDIFGQQLILDGDDNVVGKEERLLLTACRFDTDEVVQLTRNHNGIVIPAHIDRDSYSIINTLGIIPDYLPITTVEISRNTTEERILNNHPYLQRYQIIRSSDAHSLKDILERETSVHLEEKSIDNLFHTLSKRKEI